VLPVSRVDLIRSTLEAFLADGALAWDLMHEDVEIQDHDIVELGYYTGYDGFARWLEEWGEPWADWNLVPEEYLESGDCVVVIARLRATGRESGIVVERRDALVYAFRGEKVGRIDYYNDPDEALTSVGIRRGA
jgi:ketosteroid isomerase-like protein